MLLAGVWCMVWTGQAFYVNLPEAISHGFSSAGNKRCLYPQPQRQGDNPSCHFTLWHMRSASLLLGV